MTCKIEHYTGEDAVRNIKHIIKVYGHIKFDKWFHENISSWADCKYTSDLELLECFLLYDSKFSGGIGILSSFVLLKSLKNVNPKNQDQFEIKHDNPYILNYIYTFPEDRGKGLAKRLLEHLKSIRQLTVFCPILSAHLFRKTGYVEHNIIINVLVFRFP